MTKPYLAFLVLFLAWPLAAPANPVVVDKEDAFRRLLTDVEFGGNLFGDKVTAGKLKGKAVVVHHWAFGSPRCEALLPRMAELEKEYREKGLVVIGAETTGANKNDVRALLEKIKVEYTVTDKETGPDEAKELPHAFVFDAEGECIYAGSPDGPQFIETLKKAVATVKIPGGGAKRPSLLGDLPRNLVESRVWKNAEGREIIAAVKSADDNNVTFLLPNGQQTVYPLEKLSPESREAIKAARAAAAETK
jgi:thiol-disulfide isomerase/thioredoxin